ncbi:MAG TPA: UDP-3-O-(3-hydroxymyristoyl)glucosamine N-acyltransferase [Caulobacteraceae bacterium]|nr:UDP-3-O-(3-hydroxymyristoyl)glucosamine N-acyltransferase [Caulobacteraceae bacterium]
MPDPRFFESAEPLDLAQIGALTGARCASAAGRSIAAAAVLGHADAASVSFFEDARHTSQARATRAGACFVREADAGVPPGGCAALITALPKAAWAICAGRLHRPRCPDPAAPAIDPSAEIEEGVVLGRGVAVGAGAQIGAGSVIGPGAAIGPGVAIGRGAQIGANAVVGFALVGDGVLICAGAVIGEPGFGVAVGPRGLIDVPQLGRVILQDNVTVGAGACIDRGAFEDTVIGENTKIDNLVQIAHNVRIGRNCVLAAHTGISGSVTIGDGVQAGGRVGVADHVTIGAGARLAAAAGVMRDVPAGEEWGGFPAVPVKRWLRQAAWLSRAAGGREGRKEP